MTTLSYVLMDNFSPCFIQIIIILNNIYTYWQNNIKLNNSTNDWSFHFSSATFTVLIRQIVKLISESYKIKIKLQLPYFYWYTNIHAHFVAVSQTTKSAQAVGQPYLRLLRALTKKQKSKEKYKAQGQESKRLRKQLEKKVKRSKEKKQIKTSKVKRKKVH